MELINSQRSDLKAIAQCHISAFPKSLSSRLGNRYCLRMVSWYLDNERGLLFHCVDSGNIIGYCGGIKRNNSALPGSSTSITQYTFSAIIVSLLIRPWLIFHPEIRNRIPFIWKNIKLKTGFSKKFNKGSTNQTNMPFEPSLGLVVIGVDPRYQGKGYGTLLLQEFEKRAGEMGFKKIHLSVKKNNAQAIKSYQRNGWLVDQIGEEEQSMYKILGQASSETRS